MKILHIIPNLKTGGAEKLVVDLCNELARRQNTKVFLLVLQRLNSNSYLQKKISSKVELIFLNKERKYEFKQIFKILFYVYKIKPDVVHTHLRTLIYTSLTVFLYKATYFHTVHTFAQNEISRPFQLIQKILFQIFAVTPVSISNKVKQSVQILYGKRFDKVILNGINPVKKTSLFENVFSEINGYKKDKETRILLSIGKLNSNKNQLLLIKTINELLNTTYNNVILLIIGSKTSDLNYVKICEKELNKIENIKLLGEKSNVSDYLLLSDLLCLTSFVEGLGLVALEAMSAGIPIVSTPSGGIVEYIENKKWSFISSDFSEENILIQIIKFLQSESIDKEDIRQFFNKNFTIENCVNNYLRLYMNRTSK